MSNGLEVLYSLNNCFIIFLTIKPLQLRHTKENLYKMNFTKIYGTVVTNLVYYPTRDGVLKLWHHCFVHLNVKDVHSFKKMMNNMNLGKKNCPTQLLLYKACIEKKQCEIAFLTKGEANDQVF